MSKTVTRMVGPAQVPAASGTRYTVAAATTVILRHIHVQNPSGGAVTYTLSIGADAAGTRLYDAYSIAAGAVLDLWVYFILAAAEILQDNSGTNNVLVRTFDGDVLTPG